jgi:hypothetical protein
MTMSFLNDTPLHLLSVNTTEQVGRDHLPWILMDLFHLLCSSSNVLNGGIEVERVDRNQRPA